MSSGTQQRPKSEAGSDIGPYSVVREIGKGSFATVYKGRRNDTKAVVAIKAVLRARLNRKLLENLESEIQILKTLDHPHIVALLDCSKNPNYIHLVMEYCSLGDLAHFIRKREKLATMGATAAIAKRYPSVPGGGLNEVIVRHFIQQLGSALKFLHERRLIHRDVKPQNLLLNPPPDYDDDVAKISGLSGFMGLVGLPVLKLADFGFARTLPKASMAETLCGSPLYMAPEILRYEKYDAKVDLWSAGAVAYEMLVGKPPFRASNHVDLLRVIDQNDDKIIFPEKVRAGEDLKHLIRGLLRKNPVERMGFKEFFEHPVVKNRIPNADYGAAVMPETPVKKLVDAVVGAPQREPLVRGPATAPAIAPVSKYVDAREYDFEKGLPTLPIAESTMPSRPVDVRRATTSNTAPMNKAEPIPPPAKQKPGRLQIDPVGHSSSPTSTRERELAMMEAVSTPLNDRPPLVGSPARGMGMLERRDSQKRYSAHLQQERMPQSPTTTNYGQQQRQMQPSSSRNNGSSNNSDDQIVEDYVVISKQKVEVNALADELAASPTMTRGASNVGLLSRRAISGGSPVSTGKELTRLHRNDPRAQGQMQQQQLQQLQQQSAAASSRSLAAMTRPSPTSGISALAKVISSANHRLFNFGGSGAGGHSPPQSNSPFPLYPTTGFHTGSLVLLGNNGNGTVARTSTSAPGGGDATGMMMSGRPDSHAALIAIEDCANKSDIVYHLANVKYDQIAKPDPLSPQSTVDSLDLTPEAIVTISEEALVLLLKVLGLLSRAMDIAGAWWAASTRMGGGVGGETAVTERINLAVQWVRERFNESLSKAEYAQARLVSAQRLLPENHPSHPSNHPKPFSSSTSSRPSSPSASDVAPLPLAPSSTSSSPSISSSTAQVYISPHVTAEKLIYERATGMAKWATVNELTGENVDAVMTSYMSAKKMLEIVLDGDREAGEAGEAASAGGTSKSKLGGGMGETGGVRLSSEDRGFILNLIKNIDARLDCIETRIKLGQQHSHASSAPSNGGGYITATSPISRTPSLNKGYNLTRTPSTSSSHPTTTTTTKLDSTNLDLLPRGHRATAAAFAQREHDRESYFTAQTQLPRDIGGVGGGGGLEQMELASAVGTAMRRGLSREGQGRDGVGLGLGIGGRERRSGESTRGDGREQWHTPVGSLK